MSRKRMFGVTERCIFFWNQKRPRRTSPVEAVVAEELSLMAFDDFLDHRAVSVTVRLEERQATR